MEKKVKLSPSIIAVDYTNETELKNALDLLKKTGVALLHLDVMDGKFVKNTCLTPAFVEKMHRETDFLLDTHLMVCEPEKVIDDYINAGADILTVHYEATNKLPELLKKIKSNGMLAGVSIKLKTKVEVLEPLIKENLIDVVLIMGVEPGACGREFNPYALPKIEYLRRNYPKIDIEVDGGIGPKNANLVVQLGANILVSGSAIFKSANPKEVIEELMGYKTVKVSQK